ncbi:hypothetical protein ACFSKW_28060 [Nonomuraea mangrovi]|uniref:Uncharacterized protein n=1 Tax=Nonomuraea mangrovi TaxID=2316207 RepID=A0ABW4T3D1_9ACTN
MSLAVLPEILLGILLVCSAFVSAAVLWTGPPPRGVGRHRTGFCALFRHDRHQRPGRG